MTKQHSRFAETLAAAIAGQGLTLERLAVKLKTAGRPVSVATLSYWQTGRSSPTRAKSLETLAELEHILGVEPGTLTGALPDGPAKYDPLKVLPGSQTTERMLADLRLTLAQTWVRISVRDRLFVRANRTESYQVAQQVMRSAVEGARSNLLVIRQDADEPVAPHIEATYGYELIEVQHLPEEQITVARFEFPQSVPRGGVVSTEHIIRMSVTGKESFRLERSVPAITPLLVLEVEFESETPRSVFGYVRLTEDAEERTAVKPLSLQGQWCTHVVVDALPGLHGIGWEW